MGLATWQAMLASRSVMKLIICVAVAALMLHLSVVAEGAVAPTCKQMKDIYPTGKDLCEKMWSDSFTYTTDESKAYGFWFFDTNTNPNNAVTAALGKPAATNCGIPNDGGHKVTPSANSVAQTECFPFQSNNCCRESRIKSVDVIRTLYGAHYDWSRCGPMSQACERFFVQEACFYECDPNVGMYWKYANVAPTVPGYNDWQIVGMPIKASHCDAWLKACYNDYFCANDDGDFFSCAMDYVALDSSSSGGTRLSTGAIVGIVIGSVVAVGLLVLVIFLVVREKSGKPLFTPLSRAEVTHSAAAENMTL